MHHYPRWTATALGSAATLTLAACVEHPFQPRSAAVTPRSSAATAETGQPRARRHVGEEHFDRMAAAAPSFAGAFYEGGRFVTLVVDPKDDGAARAAADDEDRRRGGQSRATVEVRRAKYTYLQLAAWRDTLEPVALQVPGAIFSDLDEVENRLTIGVDRSQNAGAPGAVLHAAAALGIPTAAVGIVDAKPFRREVRSPLEARITGASRVASVQGGTLQDPNYPLRGGQAVAFSGNNPYDCTVSHQVFWQGGYRFQSNSHCSAAYFGYDAQAYSFPSFASPMGQEYYDYIGFVCGGSTQYCRQSDSNVSTMNDQSGAGFGTIHRTTFRSTTYGPGSITIDPGNPFFTVTSLENSLYVGDPLEKMGATSGWTSGQVTRVCVGTASPAYPRNDPNLRGYLKCQHYTNYYSTGGDSGSPVFRLTGGNGVRLYGVHWGGDNSGTAVYSGWRSVEEDVGEYYTGRYRAY